MDPLADAASQRALVHHIEVHYQRTLGRYLPKLRGLLRKVASVHTAHREDFAVLEASLDSLCDALEPHLKKEEEVLFPWIGSGRAEAAPVAVGVLVREHASIGAILGEVRAATNGYALPADACSTWRALWDGLKELDRNLQSHIVLEDQVLFPRVFA